MLLATDGGGNVFVAGVFWNGVNLDFLTLKYSEQGVPLWTNRYNGPGNRDDQINGLSLDSSGNVFVTGVSEGHYVTLKYSNLGLLLWTNTYKASAGSIDIPAAAAVDSGAMCL